MTGWDLWLSVAWRIVAIVLIIVEATRPAAAVSEARLVLYAAMLGLPTIVKAQPFRRDRDAPERGDESK